MGNCAMIRKTCFGCMKTENAEAKGVEGMWTGSSSKIGTSSSSSSVRCDDINNVGDEEKRHLKLESSGSCNKGRSEGVVRIRVVVTQSQLSQILKESSLSNYSTTSAAAAAGVEQLLSAAIKLRRAQISKITSDPGRGRGGTNGKWKPDLESIPEDQY